MFEILLSLQRNKDLKNNTIEIGRNFPERYRSMYVL